MQPTRGDVHVNRPLTNISIAFIQKSTDYVADKVFPQVPVMKQGDRYFVYTKDYWFRTGAQKRAPGTESAGGGFALDNTPSYFADVWAFHQDVDDQTRGNADQPLNLDRDATLFVTQQLLLRRELQFFSKYIKTGVWTGDPAGDFVPAIKWGNAGADPMNDIDTEKAVIRTQCGFLTNTLVVTEDVFFALRNNAAVLDRIKYTQRGVVTKEILAALFDVENFLVAAGVINTAAQGATAAMQYIASNSGLLVYANPTPSLMQPSGGYIFSWVGYFGAGASGNRIKTFREERIASDRVEGEMSFDMKVVAPEMGVYLKNLLS